jgi:hypothetical protein
MNPLLVYPRGSTKFKGEHSRKKNRERQALRAFLFVVAKAATHKALGAEDVATEPQISSPSAVKGSGAALKPAALH